MLTRMLMISCTLLMTVKMPKLIRSARPVALMRREFSASHTKKAFCTLKVKRGTLAGVESKNAMATPPLRMPTTKAATTAIL